MTIIQYPDPFLRQPVNKALVSKSDAPNFFKILCEVLASRPDGVAIAANQCGLDVDMFVYLNSSGDPVGVMNANITKMAQLSDKYKEGCLSFERNRYYPTRRYNRIDVNYIEFGSFEIRRRSISGFEAQVFQHEIDHLNGKLIIDYGDANE